MPKRNRSLQAKLLKAKRRGRFAVFSGATAKSAVRLKLGVYDKDGRTLSIPAGPISLSKQVMNVGRGPAKDRMKEYYNRVNPKAFLETIPQRTSKQVAAWLKEYSRVLKDTPPNSLLKINLAETTTGRLDLFCRGKEWFFIEIDFEKYIRMSRMYSAKETALERLKSDRIAWETELTPAA